MSYVVKNEILGFGGVEMVELSNNDGLTSLLTSAQDQAFNLTLINAYIGDSKFEITHAIRALLDINESSKISVYFVVVINSSDIGNSVINLGAPLIFNEDNNTMAQVPMTSDHAMLKDI